MLIIVRENDGVEKKRKRNGGGRQGKEKMYRGGGGGGGGGSKAMPMGFMSEADRKRLNGALDKHLERSSPSTSATTTTTATGRVLDGKDHHRSSSSMFKNNSSGPHHFKNAKATGDLSISHLSYYNVVLSLTKFVCFGAVTSVYVLKFDFLLIFCRF